MFSIPQPSWLCLLSSVLWRSVYTQRCLLEVCAYSAVVCAYQLLYPLEVCAYFSGVLWRSVHTHCYILWRSVLTQRCPLEVCAYPLLYPLEVCAYNIPNAISYGGLCIIPSGVLWRSVHTCCYIFWRSVLTQRCPRAYTMVYPLDYMVIQWGIYIWQSYSVEFSWSTSLYTIIILRR